MWQYPSVKTQLAILSSLRSLPPCWERNITYHLVSWILIPEEVIADKILADFDNFLEVDPRKSQMCIFHSFLNIGISKIEDHIVARLRARVIRDFIILFVELTGFLSFGSRACCQSFSMKNWNEIYGWIEIYIYTYFE